MSKQIEFKAGASANGADGFFIHVRRDDPDFIAAIHAAAVASGRDGLIKQVERYAKAHSGLASLFTKADAEPAKVPAIEPPPATFHRAKHKH